MSIQDGLATVARGRVSCLFADRPSDAHAHVDSWAADPQAPRTLVTLEWEHAPRLTSGLDETGVALATAVVELFPALYASASAREVEDRFFSDHWGDVEQGEPAVEYVKHRVPEVTLTAMRSIVRACRRRERPTLDRIPAAERVRQLSLALDPETLVIALLVLETEVCEPGALLAFGMGAQWLARNTSASVLVIVPRAFADSNELDSVRYGALSVGRVEALDSCAGPKSETVSRKKTKDKSTADVAPSTDKELLTVAPTVSVNPIRGRPHPGCDAEILLHQRISADAQLAPLFHYNQQVETQHGPTPRVDLIWPEGGLIVEIDGHPDHARKLKFCQDRERDYYLLVSGYRVLRMLDTAVLQDPELMLERIRTAVRFLQTGKT